MILDENDYIDYTIQIKDEKYVLSEKEDAHDGFLLSRRNANLKQQINNLYERFKQKNPSPEAPEIIVKAKMVWQS